MITRQDKTLTCRDCAQEFVFTASEQEFFAQKGFMNEPSRCPACRAIRKERQAREGFVSRDSFGGNTRREREMFPAVCAQCGKSTTVPFQPRNDRPVYCSECFSAQRQSSGSSYGNRGGW